MDFYDVIQNRESIRNYDDSRKISKEILMRILNAGRIAPSAVNYQPWEFLLISSNEMLEKVRACYNRDWFRDAPYILAIKGTPKNAWTRKYDNYNSLETDLTIAMDHIILAAENEGISTCWIAAFDPKILFSALNLKKDEKIYAITPLGYSKPDFKKKSNKVRKEINEVVKFI